MTEEIKTYIYGEREYVLTGRVAVKTRQSGAEKELVEIRPVTVTDPEDRAYNKWVRKSELFDIQTKDVADED